MTLKFDCSESMLQRALKCIPLGSQTFSKSHTQLPFGASPYFAVNGRGAEFWDVDGNRFLDFNSALACVSLGYADEDVNEAVYSQLQKGTIFSLATELELNVAEKLCELIPCAEMARFGKNGSDATAGAVRAARAFTGRDHVITCGYHGWQDWYIGSTTRNKGVPRSVQILTKSFNYNDLDSLERLFGSLEGKVACVIMEPLNAILPDPDFLQSVLELTHSKGALLVFDETVTGFRFAMGGAQEYFGVTPDLATFGKGMANGFPLSAVVGRKDIMSEFSEAFFSFTFGGETLSLAACLATIEKMERESVLAHTHSLGSQLWMRVSDLIQRYNLADKFELGGNSIWPFFLFKESEISKQYQLRTLYIQEMFRNGIFCIGSHNLMYSHTTQDLEELFAAYEAFFKIMVQIESGHDIDNYIDGQLLVPLFSVR